MTSPDEYTKLEEDGWDDLLGTGTIWKKTLIEGSRQSDENFDFVEAPRKFFAVIDIETKCNEKLVKSETHNNYLINCDADLFAGAHLVIPLMNLGEKARFLFDSKFAYGALGLSEVNITADSRLDCTIELKIRAPYDDFLSQMNTKEKLMLASRKKERGKFWFQREDYQNAISIYKSLADLCALD